MNSILVVLTQCDVSTNQKRENRFERLSYLFQLTLTRNVLTKALQHFEMNRVVAGEPTHRHCMFNRNYQNKLLNIDQV